MNSEENEIKCSCDDCNFLKDVFSSESRDMNKKDPSQTLRFRCMKSTIDTLVDGIINAYKECPDAENKTFEEVAEWAGKHVILTEKDEC